jgi:short-subunit dehydrogenase
MSKNKVVIITGATSGIGKALAEQFGKQGYNVFITGRDQERLESTIAALSADNISIDGMACDVGIMEDNLAMAQSCMAKFGRIDGLINNAGVSMRALFEESEIEVIEQVMQINFYGTLYATKACLNQIIENKGFVVGISSIAGFRGLPGRTGYSASKFAMQGFLEALRTELLKKSVHILIAAPGFTASNIRNTALSSDGSAQSESPRDEASMMSAEEVAIHIYEAVKSHKKVLIMTRQGKLTVFFNKWFPGFMDKLVYNALAKETNSPFK